MWLGEPGNFGSSRYLSKTIAVKLSTRFPTSGMIGQTSGTIGVNFMTESREIATLGGGCFWCLEAIFSELAGVVEAVSGYSGGRVDNPGYEEVCSGKTGHAEVVQVTFDPAVISYAEILEVFFAIHDPTTLNRQGNDVGTQYRSVIFVHSEKQKASAEEMIREVSGKWGEPIVTEVTSFEKFFPAEDYHQDYIRNNSFRPYCQLVVRPKLQDFRTRFSGRLKT